MILIGGVDDTTLNLKQTCCRIKNGLPVCKSALDLTTAFKQRGAIAFGPKGNPCSPCGAPSVNKYPYLYAKKS